MRECPNCREGHLLDQIIEIWEKRDGRWILIQNVPALVCDECGFEAFSQETAEQLEAFTSPAGDAAAVSSSWHKVFDFNSPHPPEASNSTFVPGDLAARLAQVQGNTVAMVIVWSSI